MNVLFHFRVVVVLDSCLGRRPSTTDYNIYLNRTVVLPVVTITTPSHYSSIVVLYIYVYIITTILYRKSQQEQRSSKSHIYQSRPIRGVSTSYTYLQRTKKQVETPSIYIHYGLYTIERYYCGGGGGYGGGRQWCDEQ